MKVRAARPRSTGHLFLRFAVISLVPVIALGLVLAATYRDEARRRGLASGAAQAHLMARTAIEPLLDRDPIGNGLSRSERSGLAALDARAMSEGEVLRLRLRSTTGRIVYSADPSDIGLGGHPLGDGQVIAKLTRLHADHGTGDLGPAAVEVYHPLLDADGAPIGVLELYLPYAPIDADVSAGLQRLYTTMAAGLILLWVALFATAAWVSRRLRHQMEENVYLAGHDGLTGLPNRSVFRARAASALAHASRAGTQVTVAIIDLDRFKEVNDTLGHQRGDEVLVEIGRRIAAALAPTDSVARFGGDEFGILLTDGAAAATTLQRIRDVIGAELVIDQLPLSIEASIGYVSSPEDGSDVDTLLQRADVAMYVAKASHAGVLRYDRTDDHYDATDLGLVGQLRAAIGAGELVLHYQPKAALDGTGVQAVEALVRWEHPVHGLLGPLRFLPLAEQTDLIHELTAWVLHQALADARTADTDVAVNVSARDLGHRSFASRVLEAIDDAGIAPERLTLELTETAILADPDRAAKVLDELAQAGVRVSIDDFGQGHTSLRYLSLLPVHELKIDRAFVHGMLDNPAHAAIVRSIIDLGHNLGMRVVAEGVETAPELDALRDLGCDVAQGYVLARPMPMAALPAWLAASHATV